MNSDNIWNREHNPDRSSRQPRENRPHHRHGGDRNHQPQKSGNSDQIIDLLQEIVQQNHLMIGLLRGIRNGITSGDHAPRQAQPQNHPAQKPDEPKVQQPLPALPEVELTMADDELKPESAGGSRPLKQFVVRFDSRKPAIKETVRERAEPKNSPKPCPNDENSVGESNPFELFEKRDSGENL